MTGRVSVLVGTPTHADVKATTVGDLIALLDRHRRLDGSKEADWSYSLGTSVQNNRTLLCHTAVMVQATHVLFIDSDMRFPPDTLARLLAHGKDVVGCNYRVRTAEGFTAVQDGKEISSQGRKGLEEVDALGFGCILLDCNLFTSPLRPLDPNCFDTPFLPEGHFGGEDVNFCKHAKSKGFRIWVDHDLSNELRHSATVELGMTGWAYGG